MQLPGGLLENGQRRRDFAFHPVSGRLELELAEIAETSQSTPEAVTRALMLALSRLAGGPASYDRVAELCVADRQFLMRELERHLGNEGGWLQGECMACGARFDFRLDYADLPVQEAGEGYPEVRINLDGERLRFRLPTGADQEMMASLAEKEATAWLLRRLAIEPESRVEPEQGLYAAVEAALERITPAIVLRVQAQCPDCGAGNEVDLNPYRALDCQGGELLLEIHRIATNYHWSEKEILDLPRSRRQLYLKLIDHARGMVQ